MSKRFNKIKGTRFSETIFGTDAADKISGLDGDDVLHGLAGADYLLGGDGADTLFGGADDDTLSGNDGEDRLEGGAGDDEIWAGDGDDQLAGGDGDDGLYGDAGDDVLIGGAGGDFLDGGDGNDILIGDEGAAPSANPDLPAQLSVRGSPQVSGTFDDWLIGGAGDDLIFGGLGDDLLSGNEGNDRLYGGDGRDTLKGGDGDDLLDGGDGNDQLKGEAGDDALFGGGGNDKLKGGAGNDWIYGGAGKDKLDGGKGHDALDGGGGGDKVKAGAGNDQATYTMAENTGARDDYRGGKGYDTLMLEFTKAEWFRADVQADVAEYLQFLADHTNPHSGQANGASFHFTAFDLTARQFEDLRVFVDGVELNPADEPVDAFDDAVTLSEDAGVTGFASVLGNDDGPDLVWSVSLVSPPAEGLLVFNEGTPGAPDGRFTFDPNGAFEDLAVGESRDVSFTYEVIDANGDTDQANVTITVTGENDAVQITAEDLAGSVTEDAADPTLSDSGVIGFTDVDLSDVHSVSAVFASTSHAGQLGNLTATISDATTGDGAGEVTWSFAVSNADVQVLGAGDTITEIYTVTLTDNEGSTVTRDVAVTITGANDAPVAVDDVVSVTESESAGDVDLNVLGNDTDFDNGAVLSAVVDSGTLSGGGLYTLVADGSFDVDANGAYESLAAGETVVETVDYTVEDEHGAPDTGAAEITIHGENDAPTLAAGVAAATEDGPTVDVDLAALGDDIDSDDDGSTLSYVVSAQPGEGSASITGTTLSFDPGSDFQDLALDETRDVTVQVTATDVHGATAVNDVTVTVTGTNDAPIVLAAPSGPVTIAENVDRDTYIRSSVSNGGDMGLDKEFVTVGGWGDIYYSFFDFDLTGLPSDADQVIFRLYQIADNTNGVWTHPAKSLYTVSGDWVEDMQWPDNSTTATFVTNLPAATGVGWYEIDVTEIYNQWLDGSLAADGLQLRPNSTHANATRFASSEYDDVELRPYLVITTGDDAAQGDILAAEDGPSIELELATRFDDPDSDDDGTTLTYSVTGTPGEGTASIVGTALVFNPGADFQDLNAGETREVIVEVTATDRHGASVTDSLTVTVTGVDEVPTDPFAAVFDLTDLDRASGFVINGVAAGDRTGLPYTVQGAGDVNGDGIDDFILAAQYADVAAEDAGSAYVVFGTTGGFDFPLELTDLDGTNGFTIHGLQAGDGLGARVGAVGDLNGDGIDDFFVSATQPDLAASTRGVGYVIYGTTDPAGPVFDLSTLDGSNGFTFSGTASTTFPGYVASSAGDLNNDGVDDLVIGAGGATVDGVAKVGEAYVVFGSTAGLASLSPTDLDGTNGFRIEGANPEGLFGNKVENIGDINGDGIDDIAIGARNSSENSWRSGSAYVVFGSDDAFDPTIQLSDLDGSNGFSMFGWSSQHYVGVDIAGAGDFNGDGLADFLVGAYGGDPNGTFNAGQTFVVYGTSAGFPAELDLTGLDGTNGFVINGERTWDQSGHGIESLGDVNGDGLDDILIGAGGYDADGPDGTTYGTREGATYVVFGNTTPTDGTLNLSDLDGTDGFKFVGIDPTDGAARVGAAGDINGDGLNDILIGAAGGDPGGREDAGEVYVIYGRDAEPNYVAFSYLEDFNDGVLNGDPWSFFRRAGTEAGTSVQEHDGVLDIQNDATDNGGVARIDFDAPIRNATVTMTELQHSSNAYYLPATNFYLTDAAGEEFLLQIAWYKTAYLNQNTADGTKPKLSWEDSDGQTLRLFANTPTADLLDTWIETTMDIDSGTGRVTVDLDGDGILDFDVTDARFVDVELSGVLMNAYGWWTGQYRQVDDFAVEGLVDAFLLV